MKASVLILGGGFAGLSAAKTLARHSRLASVRLIDAKPCTEFAPMYCDLLSAGVRPQSLRTPLDPFCRKHGLQFTQARILHIDPHARSVHTTAGSFSADFLIIALGCETDFLNDPSLPEKTLPLRSVQHGLAIHHRATTHIQHCLSIARPPRILIVGGGYTGIEAASHLALLMRRLTGRPLAHLRENNQIIVAEKGPHVLRSISPSVRDWAVKLIQQHGVRILTNTTLESFRDPTTIQLTDGRKLDNTLVVWTPGVTAVTAADSINTPRQGPNLLQTDLSLRLPISDRIFAAGDIASVTPPGHHAPLRMSIQTSLSGGKFAAQNVLRILKGRPGKTFNPFDPGLVVPLAQGIGVGDIFGHQLQGRLPHDLHYFMCVFRSWTWQNRLAVIHDIFRSHRSLRARL